MQVLADPEPVHVHPDADLTEITLAMAGYNLLVLTIDDVLEAAVSPEQRRMRE